MRAQRTALLRITHGSPSKREARARGNARLALEEGGKAAGNKGKGDSCFLLKFVIST